MKIIVLTTAISLLASLAKAQSVSPAGVYAASSSGSAGMVTLEWNLGGIYDLQEPVTLYTLMDGDWTNPLVWSLGRLPLAGERVQLRHRISLPASYQALAGQLVYQTGGRLFFGSMATLKLTL